MIVVLLAAAWILSVGCSAMWGYRMGVAEEHERTVRRFLERQASQRVIIEQARDRARAAARRFPMEIDSSSLTDDRREESDLYVPIDSVDVVIEAFVAEELKK